MTSSLQEARQKKLQLQQRIDELNSILQRERQKDSADLAQIAKCESTMEQMLYQLSGMELGISRRFALSEPIKDDQLIAYYKERLSKEDPNIWILTHSG
jgi:hypothetical protein